MTAKLESTIWVAGGVKLKIGYRSSFWITKKEKNTWKEERKILKNCMN